MNGEWVKIVDLVLDGERFKDHSVTLNALEELIEYQNLITQTAIELFKRQNPNYKRLPDNFKEKTILRFSKINPGSASFPLEAYFENGEQHELFKDNPITEAVSLTAKTIESLSNGKSLPETLPKNVIPIFSRLGQTLREGEKIKIKPSNTEKIFDFTPEVRSQLISFSEKSYVDKIDLVGNVGAADVIHQTFQLYINEKKNYTIEFSSELEETITTALKEHRYKKLHVVGMGEYYPDGTLKKILSLDRLQELNNIYESKNSFAIIDKILKIMETVPETELNVLPKDFSSNHDFYLTQR